MHHECRRFVAAHPRNRRTTVNALALYSRLKRPVELITARQQPSPRPENTREQASCLKSSVTLVSDDASQGAKSVHFSALNFPGSSQNGNDAARVSNQPFGQQK